VAFDSKTSKFGCHECIYMGALENPEFITMKAREIHDRFKQNYSDFQQVLHKMQEVQPQAVTQSIRNQVSSYFANVRSKFDDIEMEVMNSIKHSQGLQTYLQSAESLTGCLNDDIIDFVEDENQNLEEKVHGDKYAYMVVRHKFYNELDRSITKMVADSDAEIARIHSLESRIFSINAKVDK
jgi:ribosomal protein S17E